MPEFCPAALFKSSSRAQTAIKKNEIKVEIFAGH
jgi:hypothetical protein